VAERRVLVTGASGVIGRWTIPALAARHFELHASMHSHSLLPAGHSSLAAVHAVDLLDAHAVTGFVQAVRPTHLLHLAWITRPGAYLTDPDNARWLSAGRVLVTEAVASGCRRVVIAGSCAEYDWSHSPCSEATTPLSDRTPYAAAKNALRRHLEETAARTGMSWAWGRVFHLFGPGEHPARFVPYVIRSALNNERIRCSHGLQTRDYSYAADLATAFAALLDSEVEGPINLGSGRASSLRDIVAAVTSAVPGFTAGVEYAAPISNPEDPAELLPELSRLHCELQWSPPVGMEQGLQETIAWWRNQATEAVNA